MIKLSILSYLKIYAFMVMNGILLLFIFTSCDETAAQPTSALVSNNEESNDYTMENSCYTIVVGETPVDDISFKQLQVNCPEGSRAMGAGWSVLDETGAILDGQATYFQPSYDGIGWLSNAKNESGFASEWKLRVRLICACETIFQ